MNVTILDAYTSRGPAATAMDVCQIEVAEARDHSWYAAALDIGIQPSIIGYGYDAQKPGFNQTEIAGNK